MSTLERLEDLLARYDADAKFTIGSLSAWSGELRVTLTNPEQEPSRSATFYTAGAFDPEDAAEMLLADFEAWRQESGVEPMPVPDWMR